MRCSSHDVWPPHGRETSWGPGVMPRLNEHVLGAGHHVPLLVSMSVLGSRHRVRTLSTKPHLQKISSAWLPCVRPSSLPCIHGHADGSYHCPDRRLDVMPSHGCGRAGRLTRPRCCCLISHTNFHAMRERCVESTTLFACVLKYFVAGMGLFVEHAPPSSGPRETRRRCTLQDRDHWLTQRPDTKCDAKPIRWV